MRTGCTFSIVCTIYYYIYICVCVCLQVHNNTKICDTSRRINHRWASWTYRAFRERCKQVFNGHYYTVIQKIYNNIRYVKCGIFQKKKHISLYLVGPSCIVFQNKSKAIRVFIKLNSLLYQLHRARVDLTTNFSKRFGTETHYCIKVYYHYSSWLLSSSCLN